MAIQWTGSGPDVLLHLDRDAAEPLGRQLQREVRTAIRGGRLAAGERLPSTRALARELGLSRGLVVDCYQQLEAEGFLDTRPGAATRVAQTAAARTAAIAPLRAPQRLRTDFFPGVPDLASFPARDWCWAVGEATRQAPKVLAGYPDPAGNDRLRTVVAAYLGRVRGAATDPHHIVVCAGFTQGVGLALQVLAGRGHTRLAVEDPGHPDSAEIAHHAGMTPVPVRVDERGVDVDDLWASGARAVVLTPAHQTPTGVVLAPDRRQAVAAWARERDGVVIEDDYDAEFRYDRAPVGLLQGLAPEHVVSIGTVSKSLAPTLRLGWLACPTALAGPIAEARRLADRGSPGIDQLALAILLESGRFDRHLRRMRATYAARRQALVAALAEHAPQLELTGLAAGFHAVAQLPGRDEDEIIAAARQRSVGLHGMRRYTLAGRRHRAALVLGFGNLTERAIADGVRTVADLL